MGKASVDDHTSSQTESHRIEATRSSASILKSVTLGLSLLSGAFLPTREYGPENHPSGPQDPPQSLLIDSTAQKSIFDDLILSPNTFSADQTKCSALQSTPINSFAQENLISAAPSALSSLPSLSYDRPVRPLLLLGGGELNADVFKYFCSWSNIADGEILVIAWGSSIPDEYFKDIAKACFDAGARKVTKMPSPEDFSKYFEDPEAGPKELLARASGLFFAGGKQTLLAERLVQTGLAELIYQRQQEDTLVIGGTSAGTAIGTLSMLAGSGEIPRELRDANYKQLNGVYLGRGIDLVPNTILDQHFSQRRRLGRLIDAVHQAPESVRWGIGIDEGTAAGCVDRRYIFPVGRHSITIVERSSTGDKPNHIKLNSDELFDLVTGKIAKQGFTQTSQVLSNLAESGQLIVPETFGQ